MRSHQAEAPVRECGAKDQVSRVGAPARRRAGVALACALALAAGCTSRTATQELKPQVTPPMIRTPGVLGLLLHLLEWPRFHPGLWLRARKRPSPW